MEDDGFEQRINEISSIYHDAIIITRKIINDLDISVDPLSQKMALALIYLHALDILKGVAVVIKERNFLSSLILTRSIYDSYFIFFACAADTEFYKEYYNQAEASRLKKINAVISMSEHGLSEQQVDELKVAKEYLVQKNNKDITILDYARKANKLKTYNMEYRLLSDSVHCSPKILEKRIVIKNEKIIEIRNEYEIEHIELFLGTGLIRYFEIFEKYYEFFGKEKLDDIVSFKELIKRVQGKTSPFFRVN